MIRRWWAAATTGPLYPADAEDMRTAVVVGLRLPVRATVAIAVVTVVLLLDYSRTFLPAALDALGRAPEVMRIIAIERALLYGFVPLLVVVVVFRDRPARYGLQLGDWRWGLALTLGGCAIMTPLVLWFAGLPDARAWYGPSSAPVGVLLATHLIELTAAEFAFRGLLMMALLRVMGPLGVVVAALPFVFAHLGKPELELFSTLAGGLVYGWLAWRTRSIVWGAIGHTYILTLVTVVAR
jgi:membrane protease YdiL (CAAX protease family)